MSEQVDVKGAERVMKAAVAATQSAEVTSHPDYILWIDRIEKFSELSAARKLKSYVAALGNAILAKATNPRIDVYSLKASDDSPGAYDARRPAERVLVPASQTYGFSLGTSGAQPLNNQPFFREHRIDRNMTVRSDARPVLTALIALLHELQQCREDDASRALSAFVAVRRNYVPRYEIAQGQGALFEWPRLASAIQSLVAEKSEGGARAQACVGGLLDALFGPALVRVGKPNEPDRHMPGDVGIRAKPEGVGFIAIFEVRDKNVPDHAVMALVAKAASAGVGRATLVAVSPGQEQLDKSDLVGRARQLGVDLRIFTSWTALVDQVVFASHGTEAETVSNAIRAIQGRLVDLEVSPAAVQRWADLAFEESPAGTPE